MTAQRKSSMNIIYFLFRALFFEMLIIFWRSLISSHVKLCFLNICIHMFAELFYCELAILIGIIFGAGDFYELSYHIIKSVRQGIFCAMIIHFFSNPFRADKTDAFKLP